MGFSNVSTARTRRLHARSFYAYVFARSFPDIEVMDACLSGTHASTSVCSSSNKPEPGYRRITNGRRETSIPNTNMRCGEGPFQRAVRIHARSCLAFADVEHQIHIAFVCLPFWQLLDYYCVEERKTGRGEEYYISRLRRQTPYLPSIRRAFCCFKQLLSGPYHPHEPFIHRINPRTRTLLMHCEPGCFLESARP